MEIRAFAEQVLLSESLAEKLTPPAARLSDAEPGQAVRVPEPARPPELRFAPRRTAPAMPRLGGLDRPERRAVVHHIMANHELQALEVMAMVLCGFPDAPAEFRRGLVGVMADEQRHTRLHADRARALDCRFGSLPVNSYIWNKARAFTGVLDYLAGMTLVFEGANLDHTLEFAEAFEASGDDRGAAILRTIHRDEIEHVRFGLEWLGRLKPPDQTDWEAFSGHLHWPLRPGKAAGNTFRRAAREAAGMTEEFINRLEMEIRDPERD